MNLKNKVYNVLKKAMLVLSLKKSKGMIKECWLHKKLPIYWKFCKWWFCAWSAPDIKNRSWRETLKALRITIRKGKFHSEIVKVIKTGYT